MSEPYQQQLAKDRSLLEGYLDEARKHNYEVDKETTDRRRDVRQKLHLIRSDKIRIANAVQRLHATIDRWLNLIVSLTEEDVERQREAKMRDETLHGEHGVTALIGHAQEFLDVLETNIVVLEMDDNELQQQSMLAPWFATTPPCNVAPLSTIPTQAAMKTSSAQLPPAHTATTSMTTEATTTPPVNVSPQIAATQAEHAPPSFTFAPISPIAMGAQQVSQQARTMIKLPQLQLVQFDGAVTKWQQFWDSFHASVHEQAMPTIHKMTHLLSVLQGAAKDAVAGYAPTEANYPIFIALLQHCFGSTERIRYHLHAELRALPKAQEKTTEVRKTFEQIERICRQLEELGDSTDHPQVMIDIESKMPAWILTRIYEEKQKENAEDWTFTKLRQHIDKILQLKENVDYETCIPLKK